MAEGVQNSAGQGMTALATTPAAKMAPKCVWMAGLVLIVTKVSALKSPMIIIVYIYFNT